MLGYDGDSEALPALTDEEWEYSAALCVLRLVLGEEFFSHYSTDKIRSFLPLLFKTKVDTLCFGVLKGHTNHNLQEVQLDFPAKF